ncbi:S8 family peptidase [Variovorax sp. UC74_104]|uniref:S8 family peptidase n=1 Tax=Variovorax sp. UC74_104 TaxID=3374555 RepID=UPI003756E1CE
MKLSQRPKRFIVVPGPSSPSVAPTPLRTMRLMRLDLRGGSPVGAAVRNGARPTRKTVRATVRPETFKVVSRSPADGALLLQPQDHFTLGQLKAHAPEGTKVLEEQWYSLERPARPWSAQSTALKKPRLRAGHTVSWSVTVVLDDGQRQRLVGALVTVMTNEGKGIGVEGTTDRYGRASFELSDKTKSVDAVYVDPLHSGWPMRVSNVLITATGYEIAVMPIDLTAPDARGMIYGKPAAGAGNRVQVAVVDTGVGRHRDLKIKRGLNTTAAESSRRFRDEDGHGSHVAGVIASSAAGWRRGEASAVELHAYRIFESGDPYASSFAIATAIKDAASRGCDLVNLSIGDSMADDGIRDAVEFAWARGCVCIAATGNDGKGQVDYPARYTEAVAISAIGLVGSWPAGTYLDWTSSPSIGKTLGGHDSFLASFSNRGAKVALTAPGVGIVSTIFGDRWGVMSGTSMATPIATGVLARRLAATPAVKSLPRDKTRSAAIVAMALQAAEDLNLPPAMQGNGLTR